MFDILTDKLTGVFSKLRNRGRLGEKDIDEALREVRLALLEADVNFKVVKDFIAKIRGRCIDQKVLESLTPDQQVVKIVHEELIAVLGPESNKLSQSPQPPSVIMLVGLQGSGKTTTAAKLALHFRKAGQKAVLVAADLRRPAAIDQLLQLGKQLDIPVYSDRAAKDAVAVCEAGRAKAVELGVHWAILDTAGRLHVDEELMDEVRRIRERLQPAEALLVVDAMTGQDAVRVAEEFHKKVGVTGLIMTKLDGDARGGAALSVRAVTGVPVKFVGIGEKADALEPFHPDRLASRILGMGDMLTLIEKAQEQVDEKKALELEKKMRQATFDLEDFLEQVQQLRKMGPLTQVLEMVPGFQVLRKKMPTGDQAEDNLKRVESIIRSMTPKERHNPTLIDGSRRKRIARGSGTTPADVNQLLNQFKEIQKVMKSLAGGGKLKPHKMMGMLANRR